MAPRHPPWTLIRLTILSCIPSLSRHTPAPAPSGTARYVLSVKDHQPFRAAPLKAFINQYSAAFPLPYSSAHENCKPATVFCLEAWGFEPQTLGLQSRCSSQLSYAPRLPYVGINGHFQYTVNFFSCLCVLFNTGYANRKPGIVNNYRPS